MNDIDKNHIWHPFTQEKTSSKNIKIVSGSKTFLIDEKGNKYLDLISSWWVNMHGHSHPKIVKAIADQAAKLEHVMFAGFTHEPAIELSNNLIKILPPHLTKIFFFR